MHTINKKVLLKQMPKPPSLIFSADDELNQDNIGVVVLSNNESKYKVGDHVKYSPFAAMPAMFNKEQILILHETDIYCKILDYAT